MIADLIAHAARLFCGCQARWVAPPPAPGPRVYFANHASHLDALVIWASLPGILRRRARAVAAADYWNAGPLRRHIAGSFRALLINRQDITRTNNPLRSMLEALDAGDALILFPEGGRGDGDELRAFQAGVWHLARKRPDLEFTPVWLENLGRVLPKGELLPVPLITAVTFGPPLRRTPELDKNQFLETLRDKLAALREAPV